MNNNFNNFNNMDDLFNQLMGGMRGYSSENRRYLINGREVTPEEFAHYRATGQLPGNAESDVQMQQHASGMKQDATRNAYFDCHGGNFHSVDSCTECFYKHVSSFYSTP